MLAFAPQDERRLPGTLWGITTFFNPAGYPNKLRNLEQFARRVRGQGLRLMVVEAARGDAGFEVDRGLCDRLVQRRSRDLLWQKERLLNVGLGCLPSDCDKVVWLDADILFDNPDWIEQTAGELERHTVLQPYDTAYWLRDGESAMPSGLVSIGNREGAWMPGMAFTMAQARDAKTTLSDYFLHGHTGFAWAARRDLLDRHGFYDAQILGNGDFVMAHAMYGNEAFWRGEHWAGDRISDRALEHLADWSRNFHADVLGDVHYVPGNIRHLWHGRQRDRRYVERLDVLRDFDFDPERDLEVDVEGCWAWASGKDELHRRVREYFVARREA